MAGPLLYRADSEAELRTVELDGLALLFHAPSGMTHIVAPPAPQILEMLRLGPADATRILDLMRARFDIGDEAAPAAIEARLAELEAAGLVRRA